MAGITTLTLGVPPGDKKFLPVRLASSLPIPMADAPNGIALMRNQPPPAATITRINEKIIRVKISQKLASYPE
ncbi:hypothetical protein [Devosia yakushimensis]|uniref:hypothetical protein n=1 Tax=Devosia yakushimensis TaxID=470028 RepID=UPI0024E04B3A|nr:hypothetical protein [Devosia yakushimensis]